MKLKIDKRICLKCGYKFIFDGEQGYLPCPKCHQGWLLKNKCMWSWCRKEKMFPYEHCEEHQTEVDNFLAGHLENGVWIWKHNLKVNVGEEK